MAFNPTNRPDVKARHNRRSGEHHITFYGTGMTVRSNDYYVPEEEVNGVVEPEMLCTNYTVIRDDAPSLWVCRDTLKKAVLDAFNAYANGRPVY